MQPLEKALDNAFKKAPQMPENGRKGLASALPWLTLIAGVLSLLGVWYLYQAVSWVNQWSGYANSLYAATGYSNPVSGIGLMSWVGLILLATQAVLFLVAFPALRAGKKAGWNLLFYAALVNFVDDIVYNLFGGYLNIGQMIFSLIGAAVGLYLLFQVRSYFGGAAVKTTPAAKTAEPKPVEKQ
jgi:hypothetical protein